LVLKLRFEVRRSLAAARARGLVAGGFQAVEQVAAALAQLRDHIVADLAELHGDVFAALGQRMGDPHRRLVDLLADEVADRRQILGQIDLNIVDRRAYLLGLSDQRVALAGEFLKQSANPDLVVAIGAFEGCDLALHQRFEFARARQGAFDAVAHRRDFTADRLADGHDGIPRHALGLGKPHGDPRHRLRDQAQFLGAPRHMGDAEKEDDRQQRRRAKADHQGGRRVVGTERGAQARQIGPRQRQAADDPGAGKDRRHKIGRTGRPLLQRSQHLADRLLVVIGDAAGLRGKVARADSAGVDGLLVSSLRTLAARPRIAREQIGHTFGPVFGSAFRPALGPGTRLGLGLILVLIFIVPDIESFLDGRQRRFRRVHHLFRVVGHFGRRLACYA
jgi:hypothetical protein